MTIIVSGSLVLYLHVCEYTHLSFGETAEKSWAVVVDAESRDGSEICPGRFGPETEPQSLVGIWREPWRGHLTAEAAGRTSAKVWMVKLI